ncbi:MAG TPA: CoA-transferase [Alphaproteobacteria bacterium]|nr:CoA-transferase [Alphaproteobacteria bacterium]
MDHREFTEVEMMTCAAARLFEDQKAYFIGIGMPQIAAMLAQKLYAPQIIWIYEYGTVAPQLPLPFEPLFLGDSKSNYRAVAWKNMNHVFAQAAQGFIDYGMLGALQIDPYGNINSSYVGGTYERPGRRFAGAGGANGIASLCWRTIFVMLQEKRRFVPQLDFVSSPGYLDGSPGARERVGLPANTGPYRVVTPMALFDFEAQSHRMRLTATAPTVKVEHVLAEMSFEPLVSPTVEEMAPPSAEELTWLRKHIDPRRLVIGKGKVMRRA